jgi:hypothetical protein
MIPLKRIAGYVCVAALAAPAQTRIDLRTQAKNPTRTGTALPSTCSVGDLFTNTSNVAGQNLYVCTAANVWTLQASGVMSFDSRVGTVVPQTGDYAASQVTNAVDRSASNIYSAGAKQTFLAGGGSAGLSLPPTPLPAGAAPGDIAVDANDNRLKVFDGAVWNALAPPAPNYSVSFTAQTSVVILGGTHNLGTANLLVQCYDNSSPPLEIEADHVSVNPTTYDVTVYFAVAQTGTCVLNGTGGGNGGTPVAAGDVTGPLNSNHVTAIQQYPVSAAAPQAGQVLVWNGVAGQWQPQTLVAGGGTGPMAGQLGDLTVQRAGAAGLTIGPNCSIATPCNVRLGSAVYSVTASSAVTLSGGSGTALIYINSTGALTVGSTLALACSGACSAVPGITSFPAGSLPLFTWTATGGTWDSAGGRDVRAFLSGGGAISVGSGMVAIGTASGTTF